jgi:hypothetical protein
MEKVAETAPLFVAGSDSRSDLLAGVGVVGVMVISFAANRDG